MAGIARIGKTTIFVMVGSASVGKPTLCQTTGIDNMSDMHVQGKLSYLTGYKLLIIAGNGCYKH